MCKIHNMYNLDISVTIMIVVDNTKVLSNLEQ